MKRSKFILAPIAAALALPSLALAEVPADIAGIATDATTLFGTVKTFVVGVVVFVVLIGIVKMIRKK